MANIKGGAMGILFTVIILILEAILFPIVLTFQSNLNDSTWVTTTDRTILANNSTLMIVMMIMTLIGGVVASLIVAIKT